MLGYLNRDSFPISIRRREKGEEMEGKKDAEENRQINDASDWLYGLRP